MKDGERDQLDTVSQNSLGVNYGFCIYLMSDNIKLFKIKVF